MKGSIDNFREFFESMKDMIVVATPKGKVLFINKYLEERLGYSLKEVQKIGVLGLNPKAKRKEAEKIFTEMLKGKRDYCPLPLEAKDGRLIPVETRMFNGKWDGEDCVFGISKDLTVQQAALEKFQKIFDNNPMPMAISSAADRKFIEVNKAFRDLLGYEEKDIVGKTAKDLGLFPDEYEQIATAEELTKTGKIRNRELKVKTKDGRVLIGLFFGEVVEIQDKQAFLTTMLNITERKKSESTQEAFNKMMVGREIKMVELKRKVAELEAELANR